MTSKYCNGCKTILSIDFFGKNKSHKDGLQRRCRRCKNLERKNWMKSNPGKEKEYSIRYRATVPKEIEAERCRKKRSKNPEVYRKITKTYRDSNPEKQIAKLAKRRASKLEATPSWLTKAQHAEMTDIYKQAKELEKIFFNRKFHVDHIIPLQGKDVCGLHVPWNLQILTAEENIAKSNKYG